MERIFFKPEKLFLIICLFWGFFYLVLSPPFTAADECSHFWKIHLLASGHFGTKKLTSDVMLGIPRGKILSQSGEYIPLGMVKAGHRNIKTRGRLTEKTSFEVTKEILSYPLQKDIQVFNTFPVPFYSGLSYLTSIPVMKVMQISKVNPGWMMYILRLVSLFTYTALIYAAIKITPVKKWLFFALALLPTAVYQASMINTDGITTGTGFIFIALTLYFAYGKNNTMLSTKQLVFYALTAVYFLICKFAYIPMIFIYFLIPSKKFVDKKIQIGTFLLILLAVMSYTFLTFILNDHANKGTDCYFERQMAAIVLAAQPLFVLKAILYTSIVQAKSFLCSIIGLFGWREVTMPAYSAVLYYFVLVSFAMCNFKDEFSRAYISLKEKIGFVFIFVSYYFILFIVLFLAFQIRTDGLIDCFFGRYFIPVLPLILLVFYNRKIQIKTEFLRFINIFIINLVLLIALIRIFIRFYV